MRYNRKPGPAPAPLWGPSYPGSTRFTTARNEIMGRNNEYLAKMHERLKAWDVEVEALAAAGRWRSTGRPGAAGRGPCARARGRWSA